MRFIKTCQTLELRTDASNFHIRVILHLLKRLGWRVSSYGSSKPDEAKVVLVKEPTYYRSTEAAIRAAGRRKKK